MTPACADRASGLVVVAIPVRDEQDRIAACLEALDNQISGRADHIVLLLNNCGDHTASIAEGMRRSLSSELHVLEVELPPAQANAGHARHLAMEAAWKITGDAGVLMTTDADGRVDPDWIGSSLAAMLAGADAVAGWAELDPQEWGAIPMALHEDDARECAYDAVCDEIHGLLDPDPADPLPRHTQASGASIAVTGWAYRAAGGIPNVPAGEDRAFIAALRRLDARIRHAPECRVVVSGRTEGRAAGGMADTIRRRLMQPDPYLDDRLEPADDCAHRASMRWLARHVADGGQYAKALPLMLGLDEATVCGLMESTSFGVAWAEVERISPRLARRRVATAGLAPQQRRAEELLDAARQDPAAVRAALLWSKTPAR
jgi:hypothetical protein